MQSYLSKFGYLVDSDPRSGTLRSKDDLEKAVRLLQRYAGLKETGQIDAATIKLMSKDRCGVPDFSKSDNARRRRRYTLQGSKWLKKVG